MSGFKGREPRLDERRAALAGNPFFKVLSASELDALLARAVSRRYQAGSPVMRRGDVSKGMAVILKGRVRVGCTTEEGREMILGVLGPGELLGEIGLLDGKSRSADVDAMDDCTLLVIERAQFMGLLRSSPDLCLRMMSYLCERIRRSNAALEELALLELPERLGRLLVRLADEYGVKSERGTRIELKLSQKDLSNLIGGSREKVNRHLRQWEQDAIIAKEHGYLMVLKPDRLGAMTIEVDARRS